MTSSKVSANIE